MINLDNYHYIFYDLETTGQNPCFDQVVRFSAIETNSNLDIINTHNINIKLRNDILPHPKALLVNKLSINDLEEGLNEYEAFKEIHKIMNKPNTINLGYNSLNFDDVFLRFGFYRNLLAPYSHQYSNHAGDNFRADVYNIIFMYYLYKQEDSITWPMINNRLSLQLEQINAINHLYEGRSHDAEVDVHVTIELAKKLKSVDSRMWHYLISSFTKNYDKQNFNKLPSITCIDNQQYPIAIFVSSKMRLKSNYCAPVIYLGHHQQMKDNILLLRLDNHEFENYNEHNFVEKIDKGIVKKKFGEPHFLIPFSDQYSRILNPHIVALAKANLLWIKHHPSAIEALSAINTSKEYSDIENLDIDASLYQEKWFSDEENKQMESFHNHDTLNKNNYITDLPNGRIKDLAIRIMGRNYFNELSSDFKEDYNSYLYSIFYNEPSQMDFRGGLRSNPLDLLQETKELLNKSNLDDLDLNILESLKDRISSKIQKQQDLGF